eukprot:11333316-Karenia_brevis.AAC.1
MALTPHAGARTCAMKLLDWWMSMTREERLIADLQSMEGMVSPYFRTQLAGGFQLMKRKVVGNGE